MLRVTGYQIPRYGQKYSVAGPEPSAFYAPGSGILDPGVRYGKIRIRDKHTAPNLISESLISTFWGKIHTLTSLLRTGIRDPGFGAFLIRDMGWKFRIRDEHLGSATLAKQLRSGSKSTKKRTVPGSATLAK
jgi:hypothetical protein